MKTEQRILNVQSTLEGEKVGMTLDPDAAAHIMGILTDLYSDPELAVIREYSTNAFDAHVEAGIERPIEVTLPTPLSPYLKIRDFGVGLDIEDIRNIYSRYGASTKRDSNDVVGMLGLGCKSALTYTDQFTLSSVKDGMCTQVSVSRDEDGSGSMTIVAEYDTDDEQGTEIVIPVKQNNNFEEIAKNFYRFWGEGTVLVNGKAPAGFVPGVKIDDDLFLVSDSQIEHDVVVMGNVAYPMGDTYNSKSYSIVAFVEIGDVQFTPSREALQMTAKTKAKIQEIKDRVEAGKQAAIEKMIDASESKPEALKVALTAESLYRYKGLLKYRGEKIPEEISASYTSEFPGGTGGVEVKRYDYKIFHVVTGHKSRWQKRWSDERAYPISHVNNGKFIVGFDGNSYSTYQFAKLEQWRKEKGHPLGTSYLLLPELPADIAEWIDPEQVFDFEEIKAQKIVKPGSRKDGRPTGAYRAIVKGVWENIQADEIDQSEPILWFNQDDSLNNIRAIFPDATFVELAANRVKKFERMFPQSMHVGQALREEADKWVKSLSKDEIIWLKIEDLGYSADRILNALDPARVNDPDFVKVLKLNKKSYPELKKQSQRFNTPKLREIKFRNPFETYPLLNHVSFYSYDDDKETTIEHLYTYVNAAYAALKESV